MCSPSILLRHLLAALFLLAFAHGAQAARPMLTDDARIVDAKACQVESFVRDNRGSTEFWALPACNFTGNLELSMGGARTHEAGATSNTDLIVQGKTLFKPLDTNGWGIGLAVGSNRHQYQGSGRDWYAYVPTSWSFADDRFVLHLNVGWMRLQGSRHDGVSWGLGSETKLTDRTWLIAETFGQETGRASVHVGFRHWLVPDRVQIDTTYGDRLGNGQRDRWFTIGLRLLSVPFLP